MPNIITLKKLLKKEYSILLYETENGFTPVAEYLTNLHPKSRYKVSRLLELLAINGNQLKMPYSKSLRDNLLELRCTTQQGQERIIYCFIAEKNCILLHAFLKKTQKTPENEIKIAIERYKDLKARFNL